MRGPRVGTKVDLEIAELIIARAKVKEEIALAQGTLNILDQEIRSRRLVLRKVFQKLVRG